MAYLIASLETQDPKKRLKDKKCSQKISKKLSVAKIVYRSSKSRYRLKILISDSSNKIDWYIT